MLVVKLSACSPLTIKVRILMMSTIVSVLKLLQKYRKLNGKVAGSDRIKAPAAGEVVIVLPLYLKGRRFESHSKHGSKTNIKYYLC